MSVVCQANARRLPIATASAQTCVTSPPYWGLRDYGTATWAGGDDPACDHLAQPVRAVGDRKATTLDGGIATTRAAELPGAAYRDVCGKCGAARVDAQLGLEPTPDAYVASMVAVFREVWRVLRDDGTLWLNLGDSYASDSKGTGGPSDKQLSNAGSRYDARRLDHGLKAKDLCGIPWRVAFALQADGWYLRSDIIWAKPNPMPESITDRPTKAHEYVFLLAKQPAYFFDADAVKERAEPASAARYQYAFSGAPDGAVIVPGDEDGQRTRPEGMRAFAGYRNVRSVWSIATSPYAGAHFATMPQALVRRCIAAGSRVGDLVLDPFVGSGTVARVAISTGRRAVGVDLNRAYLTLAQERTTVTRGLPFEDDAA